MNHKRIDIRNAIAALLIAGNTAAGPRVRKSPTDPAQACPLLDVEDLGEQQAARSLAGGPDRVIERELIIEVSAKLYETGDYITARDQLIADVERLMAYAAIPGVKYIAPAGFTPDQSNDGERPIAVGRQRFRVFYITPQGDPSATL